MKYPDLDATVKIEQSGFNITMTIETPEGEIEKVEKELDQYGLVLKGIKSPESFLHNDFQVLALKQKLELSRLELKQTTELLQIARNDINRREGRISKLENQVENLQQIIGKSIELQSKAHDFAQRAIEKHDLNEAVSKSLLLIAQAVDERKVNEKRDEVSDSLNFIKDKKPVLIPELYSFAKDAVSGAGGSLLFELIKGIIF